MIEFRPEIGMIEYISEELKKLGHKYKNELSYEKNFMDLLSTQRHIPEPKKRLIIELKNITIPPDLYLGYNEIKRKIHSGESIKPHLNRLTKDISKKDKLLISWNIHHLHLGLNIESDGYTERTGPILFVMFLSGFVIFIDILQHGKGFSDVWVNKKLIEKIHNNFPQVISVYKMELITADTLDEKQMMALRKINGNHAIKMSDGTVYVLMGTMSNGQSFHDQIKLMRIAIELKTIKEKIENNQEPIMQALNYNSSDKVTLSVQPQKNGILLVYDVAKNVSLIFRETIKSE